MNHYQRTLRLGLTLIGCALVARLTDAGLLQAVADFLTQPNIAPAWIYLETGRFVRFSQSPQEDVFFALESALPDFARLEPERPSFTEEEGDGVAVRYNCTVRPDLGELITRELNWDLTGEEPAVLILHTHTTESYTRSAGEEYTETAMFRTLNENYNMLSVGDRLTELLEAGGVRVLHDRELHDYPIYNGSYTHAAESTRAYLDQYPSIGLILDLHRDAAETPTGEQVATGCTIDGEQAAQLMFVLGTDTRLQHPDWEDNLSLALKLQVLLEKETPGICRRLSLSKNRYNQHLGRYALIVEIGAAGNTLDQARPAAKKLAEAIVKLAQMQNAE